MFAAGADQEYVAAQVGHEDITMTNRIYPYVLRRKVRGEIGERRRQLLAAPLKLSETDLTVLLGDSKTASERPNKGRENADEFETRPQWSSPNHRTRRLAGILWMDDVMARPGLEPGTPRFSVVCSTS